MDRGGDQGGQVRFDELTPMLRQAEGPAQESLGRGGPQAHQDAGLHHLELALEPRPARRDLLSGRLLVDAPLSPRFELEVLDHVGDVHA